jgi:superfamily I DNA and/or RNA helicase
MLLLRHKVANRYRGKGRIVFDSINTRNDEFYKEYPVVLSTTYSAKSCAPKDGVFDYLIMDEASQVDIATGALALSCATNVVIVGDDKQLPNVIDSKTRQVLTDIEDARKIDDCFRLTTHSFLQSCVEVFNDSPSTLLREHYRCHPKIIEFCNKMFYDNELLIMTPDLGEDDVLQVYRTVPGNHARGRDQPARG